MAENSKIEWTDQAQAIRSDLAKVDQGLKLLLEALETQGAIISAIHVELCKDPPPSKIPAALAKLTEAIERLEAAMTDNGC